MFVQYAKQVVQNFYAIERVSIVDFYLEASRMPSAKLSNKIPKYKR